MEQGKPPISSGFSVVEQGAFVVSVEQFRMFTCLESRNASNNYAVWMIKVNTENDTGISVSKNELLLQLIANERQYLICKLKTAD